MNMSDGMSGFLSALGVVVLAVVFAMGLHTVLAPSEGAVPPEAVAPSVDATATSGTDDPGDDNGGTDGADVNAAATTARSDVANLGAQFAMFYAGWMEGDPAPVFAISGGNYLLNGENIGRASDGVAITGQYARGPQDWCISVTAGGVAENTYSYSSASGLQSGGC